MANPTRRNVLRGATIAAASAAAAAAGTFAATGTASATQRGGERSGRRAPVFVLLHGTNSSSFWWSGLVRELALRGHRAFAVDLPGHGFEAFYPVAYQAPQDLGALAVEPSPLAGVTLDDYEARVVEVVRRAHEIGPVILVGHSQGGASVSRVGNAVPHLIHRVVYIASFCCITVTQSEYVSGPESDLELIGAFAQHGQVGDPARLGVMRINFRTSNPDFLRAAKTMIAADFSDTAFRTMLNLLEPDETASIPLEDARGRADTWGTIPRTYIRFSEDRFITPALQDRMIAEADQLTPDNRFDVHTVHASHAGPLHRPEVVDVLHNLAKH
jgi:pimeloyl-ACP methyl ester carboxylesterase